jgi:hypothetical protein
VFFVKIGIFWKCGMPFAARRKICGKIISKIKIATTFEAKYKKIYKLPQKK